MNPERFHFTVTDLARMLGKAAVTVRKWEREGLISLPRDEGGARKLTTHDVCDVATIAFELGRITLHRRKLIESAMLLFDLIEEANK